MGRRIKNFDVSLGVTTDVDDGERTLQGTEGYDSFCVLLTQGTARIFASLDGTTFMTKQLVLCQEPPLSGDSVTAQDPVYVGLASANVPAWFFGDYKALKIVQEGATKMLGRLSCAGDKW